MDNSNSNANSNSNGNHSDVCFCGRPMRVMTSWTDGNPGRRFRTCENEGKMCAFFKWEDPPICRCARTIIPGLLRRIKTLEEVNRRRRTRERKLWLSLVVIVVIMLGMIVGR